MTNPSLGGSPAEGPPPTRPDAHPSAPPSGRSPTFKVAAAAIVVGLFVIAVTAVATVIVTRSHDPAPASSAPHAGCRRFLDVRASIGRVSEKEALRAINGIDANELDAVRDAARDDEGDLRRMATDLAAALRRDDFDQTVQGFIALSELCDRQMNR